MGMAKLNIWVSGLDDPCSIDDRTWYVTIYKCDGSVLQWCGKKYVVLPAKCGHLEVEVPPGCYRIIAVWSFSFAGGIYYVNHFTDSAVVQACCCEHVCVTLFTPSIHRCGRIFVKAVHDLIAQKGADPRLAREVEGAVERLLGALPPPPRGFELDHLDEIEALVREQEGRQPEGRES
jgi:hypothetical protein